jgi:erythromycin esterase
LEEWVVEWLRDAVTVLDSPEPDAGLADLEPLTGAFADRSVVGLGEATHGTREFFQLKHRLVRLLVETLDFRVFALEANFSETLAINDYVLRGECNPEDALDGVYFWTWNTDEVLALVEWLRAFNDGHDLDDRVRFYGFDVQYTAEAARAVRQYLDAVDPAALDGVDDDLVALTEDETNRRGDDTPDERWAELERVVADLRERFEAQRADYVAASAEREYDLARRHLRTLAQAIELRRVDDDEHPERGVAVRDRHMAENALWIREFEAEPMAVWAHDAHVKTGEMDDDWPEPAPAMGRHLRDALGDDYYALGFDFGRGEFQAILDTEGYEEGDDGEYDPGLQAFAVEAFETAYDGESDGDRPNPALHTAMNRLGESPAFLDFDRAADAGLADWLHREHPTRSIGSVFSPEVDASEYYRRTHLPEAFDGLLWVAETNRAVPVGEE